ncbi:hypothetical protein AB0C02_30120 [Micromonospora sp. NPDC048999]|uniref:hypothetical protein n=1 Tax=Micromonospora sp. NPDC048999 TaxID=3155391 RepID=UPI0033C71A95
MCDTPVGLGMGMPSRRQMSLRAPSAATRRRARRFLVPCAALECGGDPVVVDAHVDQFGAEVDAPRVEPFGVGAQQG